MQPLLGPSHQEEPLEQGVVRKEKVVSLRLSSHIMLHTWVNAQADWRPACARGLLL